MTYSAAEVCRAKAYYDTEFEATIAAAKFGYKVDEEMTPYQCPRGKHWHITHIAQDKRGKHELRLKKDFCDACNSAMRPGRWYAHEKTRGHKRNVEKMKEKRAQ